MKKILSGDLVDSLVDILKLKAMMSKLKEGAYDVSKIYL